MPGTNNNSASDPHNIAGLYLTTSGYDGCVKIWSGDDFRLVKSLDGHDGKVMGVDISKGKIYNCTLNHYPDCFFFLIR